MKLAVVCFDNPTAYATDRRKSSVALALKTLGAVSCREVANPATTVFARFSGSTAPRTLRRSIESALDPRSGAAVLCFGNEVWRFVAGRSSQWKRVRQ